MGDWPLRGRAGRVRGSIPCTTVTTGVGANIKSPSWVELVASTEVGGFHDITIMGGDKYGDMLVDIAIGPAGSEVVLISNLYHRLVNASTHLRNSSYYRLPIYIPAGTRISAKSQSTYNNANNIEVFSTISEQGGFGAENQLALCKTYGANTSDSGGTSVDPGATINTKGSWVELSSALEYDVKGLIITSGCQNNTYRATCTWGVDIGIGTSGSEVELISSLPFAVHAYGDVITPNFTELLEVNIPKNTRLVARAQCTISDATDRLLDIIAYAFS